MWWRTLVAKIRMLHEEGGDAWTVAERVLFFAIAAGLVAVVLLVVG